MGRSEAASGRAPPADVRPIAAEAWLEEPEEEQRMSLVSPIHGSAGLAVRQGAHDKVSCRERSERPP